MKRYDKLKDNTIQKQSLFKKRKQPKRKQKGKHLIKNKRNFIHK